MIVRREVLDVPLCVRSGQVFRWRPVGTGYLGFDGALRLAATPTRDGWEITGAPDPDLTRLFRLDENLDEIRAEIMAAEPRLADCVAERPGFRLMRPHDPVEALVGFLCTSNNSLHRIEPMVAHLASYGRNDAFPDLERIAAIPEGDLRAARFGYRGATIPLAAQALVGRGGREYVLQLKVVPFELAREELLTLPGVGPKLADCIALFALHHDDAAPIDTHIWQQLTRRIFTEWQGQPLTPARYREATAWFRGTFGRRAGWAQQFLFFDAIRGKVKLS